MTNNSLVRRLRVAALAVVLGVSVCGVDLRAAEPEPTTRSHSVGQPDSIRPQTARPIPMKIRRYCRWLLTKHDLNGDGVLQENEWRALQGQPQRIDSNGDRTIDLDELIRWTADYGSKREIGVPHELPAPISATKDPESTGQNAEQESTNANSQSSGRRRDAKFYVPDKRLPAGLPEWFLARDEDGDAQLTLAEFSPSGLASDAAEFARYDVNRDGMMTAQECVGRPSEKSASARVSAETNASDATPPTPPAGRRKSPKKLK